MKAVSYIALALSVIALALGLYALAGGFSSAGTALLGSSRTTSSVGTAQPVSGTVSTANLTLSIVPEPKQVSIKNPEGVELAQATFNPLTSVAVDGSTAFRGWYLKELVLNQAGVAAAKSLVAGVSDPSALTGAALAAYEDEVEVKVRIHLDYRDTSLQLIAHATDLSTGTLQAARGVLSNARELFSDRNTVVRATGLTSAESSSLVKMLVVIGTGSGCNESEIGCGGNTGDN